MNILITGSAGFIGSELCAHLSADNTIIGVDITERPDRPANITWEQADLTDGDSARAICEKYSPDVVIHCAGIAHQKIGSVDSAIYMRVNSEATENLARAASRVNPDVRFIFFSSVSVYGEDNLSVPVSEEDPCHPSSDYAASKLDAEKKLAVLVDKGALNELVILRLAPVYDREWSLNLDRRVFAPRKLAYLRFGPGSQEMSALARPNLVAFIEYMLQTNECPSLRIFNVCDAKPYTFNAIIKAFRESGVHPDKPLIPVPLPPVWGATRLAGIFFSDTGKRGWIHSCYNKVASDLVFDNRAMLETGFRPVHSLETIFRPIARMPVSRRRAQ